MSLLPTGAGMPRQDVEMPIKAEHALLWMSHDMTG